MSRAFIIRTPLVLSIFWISTGMLSAFHIIGGEITYECLGPSSTPGVNIYEFRMFVFRDCQGNGADLDREALIGVWLGDNAPYQFVDQLVIPILDSLDVEPPEIECLIPPDNVCVQEGIYTWTLALPVRSESYHITYQRCCRNSSINNILDPDRSGATYTMEINTLAQNSCNNSPTFKEFPPTIICVNQPVSFDHSAIDSDGDSLIYTFENPLLGGSFGNGNGNNGPCDGPVPPGCEPPYDPVRFRAPIYDSSIPLGGLPAVQIDRFTGEITGIPNTTGQFVVGVRVTEYRDGEVIGQLNRDFQFNVADCESLVNAEIQIDETIGPKDYLLTSCGQETIDFVNLSTVESQIFSYLWEFDLGEGEFTDITSRNATVTFPDTGTYNGWMFLNRNSICEDSASITVRILPETVADYEFDYDTCVVGPVTFTNLSTTEADRIVSHTWDFGGTGTSNQVSPIYNFPQPSTQPVSLTVVDNNGCMDVSVQDVIWQPAPQTVIVQPNTFLGCEPAQITFINLSAPIDETYTFNWDFGDGNTGSDLSPVHTYEQTGVYDVSLEIISPIGCQVAASFNSLIRVEPGPEANFDFTPKELDVFNNQVQFVDQSTAAASWFWSFADQAFSTDENPIYTFPDTGVQEVRLIVTRDNGCQDTISQFLDVIPVVLFHMPNAFTPNNDGINEEFLGKGIVNGMRDFEFTIWNRWGEQVFSTTDPFAGWNGRKNNVGANSPVGSYPYLVTFSGPRGEPYKFKGQANLIR